MAELGHKNITERERAARHRRERGISANTSPRWRLACWIRKRQYSLLKSTLKATCTIRCTAAALRGHRQEPTNAAAVARAGRSGFVHSSRTECIFGGVQNAWMHVADKGSKPAGVNTRRWAIVPLRSTATPWTAAEERLLRRRGVPWSTQLQLARSLLSRHFNLQLKATNNHLDSIQSFIPE